MGHPTMAGPTTARSGARPPLSGKGSGGKGSTGKASAGKASAKAKAASEYETPTNPTVARGRPPLSAGSGGRSSSNKRKSPAGSAASDGSSKKRTAMGIVPSFVFRQAKVDPGDLTYQPKSASSDKPSGAWIFDLDTQVAAIAANLEGGEWNIYLVGQAWEEEMSIGNKFDKGVTCYVPRFAVHCLPSVPGQAHPDSIRDRNTSSLPLDSLALYWEKVPVKIPGVQVFMLGGKKKRTTRRPLTNMCRGHIEVRVASAKHFKIYPQNLDYFHLNWLVNTAKQATQFGFEGCPDAEKAYPDPDGDDYAMPGNPFGQVRGIRSEDK